MHVERAVALRGDAEVIQIDRSYVDLASVGWEGTPVEMDGSAKVGANGEDCRFGDASFEVDGVRSWFGLCGVDLERFEVDYRYVDDVACDSKQHRTGEDDQPNEHGDGKNKKETASQFATVEFLGVDGVSSCEKSDGLTGLVVSDLLVPVSVLG